MHGFGYAFDGEVMALDAAAASGPRTDRAPRLRPARASSGRTRSSPWPRGRASWGAIRAAQVLVDVPGVSRRHARIVVRGAEVAVEDLGSKNGTFVEDRRVDGPTPLADRDRVRLGHTVLVYRCARLPGSTETELP